MSVMAATEEISLDDFRLWRVVASVEAIATYETSTVGFGTAGGAHRRQVLVTVNVPVAVHAPDPVTAQTLAPEVLASFSSEELLAAGQIFHRFGSAPAPNSVKRVALLNPDELTVLDVEPIL